jgi:hypothetical protein
MAMVMFGHVPMVSANITVAEYISLRAQAHQGNKGANARWRYYIIGLMDGLQAVQAPATEQGAKLHFCMPSDFPVSPKFFDSFIQEALKRYEEAGKLRPRLQTPMAVMIAVELSVAFPCPGD